MTSVECGTREVSAQIRQTRLRDAHLGARQSRLVCFAQALVRRPRSTSAGCGSRLQACGALVWKHGVGVYVLNCRHTWAHANVIQPLSCRVTTKRCFRSRRNMLVKTKVPPVVFRTDATCKSALCSQPATVPCLPLRYSRPATLPALAPSVNDPAIDC